MNIFYAIGLGILQGLTEFLPVSSSGHLVLAQNILPNFSQPGALFDVILHFGTLIAVLFYFRKELLKLPFKYYLFIAFGTIPAVFVGFLLASKLEILFSGFRYVGLAFILTGVMNLFTDRYSEGNRNMDFKKSFVTGVFQALAVIPGISRSGSTIFSSVFQGVDKKSAAKFSFLLSIPAILGANVLEIGKYGFAAIENFYFYLLGFMAAAISGYFAISLVFRIISIKKFKIFAIYCFVLGFLVILL